MISAVILTKNEVKNIKDCLESLSFCNEIIVVDDNSTDKTVEIAKRKGAKVFVNPLNNDFSSQRNFGLDRAKGEWVLFVDADETITPSLRDEIKSEIRLSTRNLLKASNSKFEIDGYKIKRVDFMWGRQLKHGETGNINLLRLAKKDAGRWEGKVHERWKVKGEVGQLCQPLLHYPHPTIGEFLQEINFYTTLRAQELYKKGIKVHWWSIIIYPKTKFLLNFFLKRGFLDGVEGLLVALLMSFHSFLVRGKLWLLWKK